jgi:ATP-dependent Lon protease
MGGYFIMRELSNRLTLKQAKGRQFLCRVILFSENGAKTVLVPMDNLNEMTTLPQSIIGQTDTPFYGNSQMLLQKAVLGE